METNIPTPTRTLLDVPGAASYLTISERGVRRLISDRKIAYTKLGNLVRFQQNDLDAFVDAGRKQAISA